MTAKRAALLVAALATSVSLIVPLGGTASASPCEYEFGVHNTTTVGGRRVHSCVGFCIDGCSPFSFHVEP